MARKGFSSKEGKQLTSPFIPLPRAHVHTEIQALHHLGETPKKRGKHGKDGLMPVVALYEALMQLVLPLSTKMQDRPNTETPITTSCNIVDISGVSLMQFLRMRGHLGDASALATSKYPETLDSILVSPGISATRASQLQPFTGYLADPANLHCQR